MKLYRVNSKEVEELFSMREKLKVLYQEAIDEKRYEEADALDERIEELYQLTNKAWHPGAQVDWATLKRIREIKAKRQSIRYGKCLAAGMSEHKAAYAFM